MPRVTIWIREADMPKWETITDRPAWLHEKLAEIDIPEIEAIKHELDKGISIPQSMQDHYWGKELANDPADHIKDIQNAITQEPFEEQP